MRARYLLRLLLVGCLSLGSLSWALGCATSSPDVAVEFEPETDFSHLIQWSWQPGAGPKVYAPHGDARGLRARVSGLVEQALLEAGFQRTSGRSDFAVHYHLSLNRRAKNVEVPLAPYLLASNSSGGSYWVEGTRTERRVYDDLKLTIDVTVGAGQVVWHGAYDQELATTEQVPLEEAVKELLERFPPEDD